MRSYLRDLKRFPIGHERYNGAIKELHNDINGIIRSFHRAKTGKSKHYQLMLAIEILELCTHFGDKTQSLAARKLLKAAYEEFNDPNIPYEIIDTESLNSLIEKSASK